MTEAVDVLLGLYFLQLLRVTTQSMALLRTDTAARREMALKNRVTKTVLIVELVLNAIPNLITAAFNAVS